MTLCSSCEKLDLHTLLLSNDGDRLWPSDGGWVPASYYRNSEQQVYFLHSGSIIDIRRSAAAGCEICQLLTASLKTKRQDVLRDAEGLPVALTRSYLPDTYVDDDFEETVPQAVQLASCINVFAADDVKKEMISLCTLSLSIDKGVPCREPSSMRATYLTVEYSHRHVE
jgi:hypothetical protein